MTPQEAILKVREIVDPSDKEGDYEQLRLIRSVLDETDGVEASVEITAPPAGLHEACEVGLSQLLQQNPYDVLLRHGVEDHTPVPFNWHNAADGIREWLKGD